jgi:hypothetical protein
VKRVERVQGESVKSKFLKRDLIDYLSKNIAILSLFVSGRAHDPASS